MDVLAFSVSTSALPGASVSIGQSASSTDFRTYSTIFYSDTRIIHKYTTISAVIGPEGLRTTTEWDYNSTVYTDPFASTHARQFAVGLGLLIVAAIIAAVLVAEFLRLLYRRVKSLEPSP